MNNQDIDYEYLFNLYGEESCKIFILLSEDFVIDYLNAPAEKILGWNKNHCLDKTLSTVCKAQGIELFLDEQKPIVRTKTLSLLNINNKTCKIAWTIIPVPAFKNNAAKILVIGKKIQQLSSSKLATLQLESIIKYAPGFFYWKNRHSVYQWCNDEFAKLAGIESRHDVKGKTDFDLSWKDRAQLYVDIDKQVMEKGKAILNYEENITISNKETITAITNKVPVYDENNRVIGVLGITTDITKRKNMETELIKSKEAAESGVRSRTEFIGNMSHDIRTPLTGIIGISEFLIEEFSNTDDKTKIEDIHNCGKQLLGLLNNILEVSSLDSNENEVICKPFDLYELIDDICQLEKPAVESRHLTLNKNIAPNIPRYLMGDKMKIHRILLNLIGNGIKFTDKGSISIDVTLLEMTSNKATIEFSVQDTGIGIPEEALSQVFERFYKVSPSWKGKFSGNGIGLHIVQKFISLLGGKIDLESKVGEGTRFYFSLTMTLGEEISERDEDYEKLLQTERLLTTLQPVNALPLTPSAKTGNQPAILIIEDFAMALKTLRLLLSRFDVSIREAMDAETALEIIKNHPPFDLIITDIGLPGISGDEMVRQIRRYEEENGLPAQKIVALTGHAADGEFGQKCQEAGIDKVYKKPMDTVTLKGLIEPLFKADHSPSQAPKSAGSVGKLGFDLPDTEAELFELHQYPLFDISLGEKVLGSREIVYEIMKDFKQSNIGDDLDKIKIAHARKDWATIEKLTHKIKGGSCFGTARLFYALLYMERYLKAGHSQCAEALYKQMLRIIDETVNYLENNLTCL